ncbi:MAG: hypothetical protein ABSB18_07400 [Candidatus Omnitrophota bacterium]
MKKALVITVALVFFFGSGLVTQAKAGGSGKNMAVGAGAGWVAGGPVGAGIGGAVGGLFGGGHKSEPTTGSQYKKYLNYDKKIDKLETKLGGLTPGTKQYDKVENRINKLYTKAFNTNPVVGGLRAYQRNEAKLNKIESKLQSGNLTQKQVDKLNKQAAKLEVKIVNNSAKAIASEQKQYNKLQTKIGKLEVKAALDSGNPNKLAKDQKKINYLKGEASWLQSTVNTRLSGTTGTINTK